MRRLIDVDLYKEDMTHEFPEYYEEVLDAQPIVMMALTVDDMKVIRIHMGAICGRLCNQKRWGEAVEYQNIINKLDAMIKMEED